MHNSKECFIELTSATFWLQGVAEWDYISADFSFSFTKILILTLGPSAKLAFLEYLRVNSVNNKILPLNIDQKVCLISCLLNSRVLEFDFLTLGSLAEYELPDVHRWQWENACRQLWDQLAVKCPNLQVLKENIPTYQEFQNFITRKNVVGQKLNNKVAYFPSLLCLETYSYITSGNFISFSDLKHYNNIDFVYR